MMWAQNQRALHDVLADRQLPDTAPITMPAGLARKLVREADALERTKLGILWIVLGVAMASALALQCGRVERDATHEPAHVGEQL